MISRTGRTGVFLAAALYGVAVALLTGPGFASFDTAYQWWMARHLSVSTLWPPSYVYSFWLLEATVPWLDAPTSWYVINLVLACLSAAGIATSCARSVTGALFLLLLLLAAPVFWLLIPHVWSDVALVTVLMTVSALFLVATSDDNSRSLRRAAVISTAIGLLLACGIRHNAVAAVFPLLAYWCMIARAKWCSSRELGALFAATCLGGLMSCMFFAAHSAVGHLASQTRSDTWAITAIWDLQALTVASGVNLIPVSISPNTSVADMRASFDPTNAVHMYTASRARWVNATMGLTHSERTDLGGAWLTAVSNYPSAYLRHRWHALMAMVGASTSSGRIGTRVEPVQTPFADNPSRS